MAEHLARRCAVRRVPRVADLGDPRICDHREQECRVRSRQVVVVDDPVEEFAERLARAPFQGSAGDERSETVTRLDARPFERRRPLPRLGARRDQRADLGRGDDLAVAHQRLAVAEVKPALRRAPRAERGWPPHGARGSRDCRRSGPEASRAPRRPPGRPRGSRSEVVSAASFGRRSAGRRPALERVAQAVSSSHHSNGSVAV